MQKKSVLIIKHGFSETCDHSVSPVVSLGDVFRCTCLLEDFRGAEVTWITAHSAYELLMQNHLIDRLILAESPSELPAGFPERPFDSIINLEKQKDWCEFALGLAAGEKYGFRDWTSTGDDCFYPASARALAAGLDRGAFRPVQETLFATIGREWRGQRYVLGYQPPVMPIYDIGLNYNVGSKWPTKAWPKAHWERLCEELSRHWAVSWQQSPGNIRHYIDWVASCRLLITCDSLGLHLALGLGRKVIALFGPTAPEQIYLYGQGFKLTPACPRKCIPCYRPRCDFADTCMEHLAPRQVLQTVEILLGTPARKSLRPRMVAAAEEYQISKF